jgi:hypothetical protein
MPIVSGAGSALWSAHELAEVVVGPQAVARFLRGEHPEPLGGVLGDRVVLEELRLAYGIDLVKATSSLAKPSEVGHARDLAMMAWFAARGANNAGQWPGDPDDDAKQNQARADFDAWWRPSLPVGTGK